MTKIDGGKRAYPLQPEGTKVLLKVSSSEMTTYDKFVVAWSSLFFVGGVFWVPLVYVSLIRKLRNIPKDQRRRRAMYAAVLLSITTLYAVGPHRKQTASNWVNVHRWSLWKSWMRFFAFEVVTDEYDAVRNILHRQAILGISPHGIFPFALAVAAWSEKASQAFGNFRIVIASATRLLPWVRDVLVWVNACDADRPSVDKALSEGWRLGLAPGGIAEITQAPEPTKEYAIVRRGIFRLAMKYQVPIVPIYCFGSSMLMKRIQIPLIEKIGVLFRISLVAFFGQWGLPIPFRQRLLYVIGKPVYPPKLQLANKTMDDDVKIVDEMHQQYCQELIRYVIIFVLESSKRVIVLSPLRVQYSLLQRARREHLFISFNFVLRTMTKSNAPLIALTINFVADIVLLYHIESLITTRNRMHRVGKINR